MTDPQPTPSAPIQGGPQTAIPQVDIPHMGTSQANVPNPTPPGAAAPTAQQPQPKAMPPLPPGISLDDVNAAIAQVQQTGNTQGIAQDVLSAACTQIEAQAAAQGIDLNAVQTAPQNTPAPSSPVEAAVMDKKGTFDSFAQQRDSMKDAVASQRDAMQQPYKDAMAQAGQGMGMGGNATITPEQMSQLAEAVKDLDPDTMALVNALGMMSSNPSLLNSVVWIEIIRTIRHLIAKEAQKQVQLALTPQAT